MRSTRKITFGHLIQREQFRDRDPQSLVRAIKSLVIACLVYGDEQEVLVASPMAQHYRWLTTEVEPLNG